MEPIFKRSTCYDCHEGDDAKGSFDLTDSASVQEAITAGDPDGSELIVRLTDPSDPMPPEVRETCCLRLTSEDQGLDCGRRTVLGGFMIHILRDGQQFGPYSLEEINVSRRRQFAAFGSGLVRRAPEWIPLTEVPGVALLAQPVSSPVATGVVASGGSSKRKKLLIGIAAGVVVLAGGAFAGMHFLGGEKESEKPVGTSANKEKGVDGSVENAPTTGGQ